MNPTLLRLIDRLRSRGHEQYDGEAVTQLAHALQCATHAQANHASPELVTAGLFHDLGHLIDAGEEAIGEESRHEYRALDLLRSIFPAAVTEPVRLHVEAKRYLCAVNPRYWQTLSPASQHSLQQQGGIFSPIEAAAFITHPYGEAAVQLRQWDDRAKVVTAATPSLAVFVAIAHSCLR